MSVKLNHANIICGISHWIFKLDRKKKLQILLTYENELNMYLPFMLISK